MIKTDIVAYVSSYALEGQLIVPSVVLTSTPQEEEINLTYTPNFQLKLMDKNSYVVDDAWMSFSYSDTNYTAYMNVVNRTQDGIVTLQYNNGLRSEEIPTPEPPQPEPVDPLDSMLTIAGPLTPDPEDSSYSIVYSYETQDVYIKSRGMTYDSTNNRYEFAPDDEFDVVSFFAPTTHVFESITFVNLDSTYKSALLQTGEFGYGVLTEDVDGNLRWSRTTDYDPTETKGWINFVFEQIIQQVGAPMTFEEIRITMAPYVVPTEPPYFTSPADGDTITGTIDTESQDFKYPIELAYGDGTQIPHDITATCVTCDSQDVSIGYTEDADENDQTYISGVYMYIYSAGSGNATLTYEDPNTGDTCTVTFDYDISAAAEPQQSVILTSANIRTAQGDSETGASMTYPYQGNNPINTIDANLTMSLDGDPAIACYNLTNGTNSNIELKAGCGFTLESSADGIAQVIITLNPDYNNDTSELDVQPNENKNNQLIYYVNNMSFSFSAGSTPLYFTQIEVIYA